MSFFGHDALPRPHQGTKRVRRNERGIPQNTGFFFPEKGPTSHLAGAASHDRNPHTRLMGGDFYRARYSGPAAAQWRRWTECCDEAANLVAPLFFFHTVCVCARVVCTCRFKPTPHSTNDPPPPPARVLSPAPARVWVGRQRNAGVRFTRFSLGDVWGGWRSLVVLYSSFHRPSPIALLCLNW